MTQYYGISRDQFGRRWQAAITDLSEQPLVLYNFGSFDTALHAALAHDMAALLFHGRYAKNLNFPENKTKLLRSIETYRDQLMIESYGAHQNGVWQLEGGTWATVKWVTIYPDLNCKKQELIGIFGTDVAAALLSDNYEKACGNYANLNFPGLAGNGMVTVAEELAWQHPESGMTHCQGGESPETEDYCMMHCQGGEGESPELGGGMHHCQGGETPKPESGMKHCQDGGW